MDETLESFQIRYQKALHAMQTGVAIEMTRQPESTEPKHLRVGVNSAMVEHSALVKLLIASGVITEEQFMAALAEGMEAEKTRYEQRLSRLLGTPVTLV